MIVIYGQTDRVMLKLMIGDVETGYYSAAAYCAGMASFVFTAIIDSMRPAIFKRRGDNEAAFEDSVSKLYSMIIYLALTYSLIMSIFAPQAIEILYGDSYLAAIPVLRIIVWYCTASYLGGARDIWILAENRQKHLLLINALGACVNIFLNALLIPKWKAAGAATASVITQYAINIVFTSIYKPTRRTGRLMINGFRPKTIMEIAMKILKRKA